MRTQLKMKCGTCDEFIDIPELEEMSKPEFKFFADHPHKPTKVTVYCPCGGELILGPGAGPDANPFDQALDMVKFVLEHRDCQKKERWAN
jgi:hypothetical protein